MPHREAAFDALYARYQRRLFAFLLGKVGSRETAADLLQESFLRAWQRVDELERMAPERVESWLVSVARNAAIDAARRHSVRSHLQAPVSEPERIVSADPDPHRQSAGRAELDRLNQAILELPEELRTVLTMSVMGEMSSDEIGRVVGRPSGTVRSQLATARQQLARRLGMETTHEI